MLLPTLKTDRLRIRPLTVKDLSICHQFLCGHEMG
jgi:hypothetical protein